MAYGLEVTDLVYTNENRYDLGTLEDYEIDLDVAGEKDFTLEAGSSVDFSHRLHKTDDGRIDNSYPAEIELLIPMGGFWYVEGTEFGGIIDRFETSNSDYSLKYYGRSWRGILNSKVISADDSRGIDIEGPISAVVNTLIEIADAGDLFICEAPNVNSSVDYYVEGLTVLHGATLYDAITAIARSIFFSYNYIYSPVDSRVHIIPILSRDYTDYMTYSTDNTIKFSVGRNYSFTNHYILTSVDDYTDERWTIHIFLDEYKIIQPYATVNSDEVIKDSQYILDQSKKVLSGAKEISVYYEYSNSPVANYELLTEAPEDWEESYSGYFRHRYEIDNETLEIVGDSWNPVEAEETPEYYILNSKPDDWESNYKSYYVRSWNSDISDFEEIKAYIVGEDLFASDWLSAEDGGEALEPELGVVYTIQSQGDYYHAAFEWSGSSYFESDKTYESPHWEYQEVSEVSETVPYEQVTIRPEDWEMSYSNFYYKDIYNDGIEDREELIQYQASDDSEYYIQVNQKPSNWDTSYSNYYKYVTSYEEGDVNKPYYIQYGSKGSDNVYSLITEKPTNWDTDYASFYYHREIDNGIAVIDDYTSYSGISDPKYTKLSRKPSDWDTSYSSYYYHVDPGSTLIDEYIQYGAGEDNSEYQLVDKKPSDSYWKDHFSEYYYKRRRIIRKKNGNDVKRIEYIDYLSYASKGDESKYIQVIEKPSDWKTGYGGYYYKFQTGTEVEYRSYSGKNKDVYTKLKKEPSDWSKNFGSYFEKKVHVSGSGNKEKLTDYYKGAKDKDIRWVKVSSASKKKSKPPKFKANKYYRKDSKTTPPAFKETNTYMVGSTSSKVPKYVAGDCYVRIQSTLPPTYKSGNTYLISQEDKAPEYQHGNTYIQNGSIDTPPAFDSSNTYLLKTEEIIPEFQFDNTYLPVTEKHGPEFKSGAYYRMEMNIHAPEFMDNTFYKEELDHYASMIESLKNELANQAAGDTQTITLDDYDLDIGDLVGGKDDITGLEITQEVKNMVVKINSGVVNIDYDIGDVDVMNEEYEEYEEESEDSGGEEE